ncbi:hypothetical protein [Leptolyngbya iicbica]|uniref:Uncharacterized protein n=2 Tax=Cyanophyceae TaxID=3028117 RepID=A0A4Q7EGH6_9CYAN|nr:hypothetical protein [Leptolyngbya sp. LK]RZM82187.1 hypothetical protein DYY88_02720 [Leptolyngbya sp. LK]
MTSVDAAALRARNLLIALFGAFCGLDIVLVTLAGDAWAIGRVLLNIGVMVFVLRGRKWAKWLLIVLMGLSAFALIALLLLLGAELSSVLVVGSWILVALSILIPVYLVTNVDLKRYLAQQRQLRAQS